MKKTVLMLALTGVSLSAQSWEVGAFIGQQSYDKFSWVDTGMSIEAKPDSKTVGAVRVGYSIVDLGPALLQISAAYQPKATSQVKFNVPGSGVSSLGIGVDLDHQATSLGLMFNFKAGVAVGAGVDFRWDKLEAAFQGSSTSATYGRPWARFNIGFAFPTPALKPFLGLEVAAALSTTSVSSEGPSTDEEALKALAPKIQIGVYGGIRF